jgi:TonB family protein
LLISRILFSIGIPRNPFSVIFDVSFVGHVCIPYIHSIQDMPACQVFFLVFSGILRNRTGKGNQFAFLLFIDNGYNKRGSQMLNETAGEKLWRVSLFLFSVGLHVAFFAILLNLRYTITIYDDQREIREVVIVPEEKLRIPGNMELTSAAIQEDVRIVGRKRAQARSDAPPGGQSSADSGRSGGPEAAVPVMEGAVPVPTARFLSSSPFRFNLDWSTRLKTVEEPYFDLALDPPEGEKPPDFGEPPEGGEAGDFRRYFRRGTLRESRSKSPSVTQTTPGPVFIYDLSPWAEQVIGRIQNLWRLDAAQNGEPRGRVEVKIIVGKDGSLKSIDIIRSSDDEGLDRAALRAVESNLPFPPLPEDFPRERLEFTLVFEYDY